MISVCIFLVSWVLPLEIEYLVGLKRISLSLCYPSFCRWTDRGGSFPQCCSWISVVPPTSLMTNSNCADVGEVISLIAHFEVREGNKMRSPQFSPCLSRTYLSQFCRLRSTTFPCIIEHKKTSQSLRIAWKTRLPRPLHISKTAECDLRMLTTKTRFVDFCIRVNLTIERKSRKHRRFSRSDDFRDRGRYSSC